MSNAPTEFRPSRPRPGRLVRLGVVLDPRNPPDRLRMIARMCELAGIDAVWAHDWDALRLAADATRQMRLGATVDLATLGAAPVELADRLEVTLNGRDAMAAARRWREFAVVGIDVRTTDDANVAARLADDALLLNRQGEDLRAAVAALASACAAVGRARESLGVSVQLPVSIGRTETEAQARTADEPLFAGDGHPAISGIFGTLEMCQDRVIALAHAGVTDLRCVLPNSPDVHDVIAQLTAMVIGSVDVLQPGAPRSKAPDAPSAWGGRPRFPSA